MTTPDIRTTYQAAADTVASGSGTLPTDWTLFSTELTNRFVLWEPTIQKLCQRFFPLYWDGRKKVELPYLNDMNPATYSMDIIRKGDGLKGGTVEVPTPQIIKYAEFDRDTAAKPFNNRDAVSLTLEHMGRKMIESEDQYGFQGDSTITGGTASIGLCPGATDLTSSSAGSWGHADANGLLDYVRDDINTVKTTLAAYNLQDRKIDMVVTPPLYTKLATTRAGTFYRTNLEMRLEDLNGGSIISNHWLQSGYSSTDNTALFLVHGVSEADAGWLILQSGPDYLTDNDLTNYYFMMRRKYVSYVLKNWMVYKYTGLSTA
jgi:hypothetical protein